MEDLFKRENKGIKLAKAIEDMKIGESISLTPLSKRIGIHMNTLRDDLDKFNSLMEIGFAIIRDEEGDIKALVRTDNSLDVSKEIRDIKNKLNDFEIILKEINLKLKKK